MAFITGATFISAGLAMTVGVVPGRAAARSTLQIGLFSLIVWIPRVLAGPLNEFQWGEFVATCVLTAGAWLVTDSYRGTPWLAPDRTMGAERSLAVPIIALAA